MEGGWVVKILVVVLNETEKMEDLLLELNDKGIHGGTIIDSMGMAKTLFDKNAGLPLFGSLKHILNENKPVNKTLFMVLTEDKVTTAMDCVRKVIPNLNDENVGIMFTLPVDQAEGLTK